MERILIRSQDLLQGIPAEVSDNQIGVGYTAVVLSADAQATIADLQGQIAVERANKESAVACVDRDVKKISALQQRVAQLEQQLKEMTESKVRCWNQWTFAEQEVKELAEQRDTLQADHARVLQERDWLRIGCNILIDRASNTYHADGDEFIERVKRWRALDPSANLRTQPTLTAEEIRSIEACCERPDDCKWDGGNGCGYEGKKHLLPAQPAQGGANKPAGRMHSCDIPGCVSCGNPPDAEGETRA